MGRKGESKVRKRLNTPRFLQIKRKHGKYFVRPNPGPHPSKFCLPLLHIVRDLLKIADNYAEAKKLIGKGFGPLIVGQAFNIIESNTTQTP